MDKRKIDRSTTVDRIVALLRQEMFDGELAPGETLTELALSQGLGVARSTIREALRELVSEGLVARMPNRTLAVRHLTIAEIEALQAAVKGGTLHPMRAKKDLAKRIIADRMADKAPLN